MKRLSLSMLHDCDDSHAVLWDSSLIILVKDMEGPFAYYSKLSTSVDPTDHLESRQFCKPYRVGLARQENIDLNVLSVTITDMTCVL